MEVMPGHSIPYYIPLEEGFRLLMIGWDMLENYDFYFGDIVLNMKQIMFSILLFALLGYFLQKIFDW